MTHQFSNMSFQNKGLKGHMSFQARKIISSTGLLECYKTIHGLMASTVMIILNLIVMVKQDQTIHLN